MKTLTASGDKVQLDENALQEAGNALQACVKIKDRKFGFRTYKQCFVGRDAVDFLVSSGSATSREEAVRIGQELSRTYRLFEHVTGEHEFKDAFLFYRFSADTKNPKAHNTADSKHSFSPTKGKAAVTPKSRQDEIDEFESISQLESIGEALLGGMTVRDRRHHLRVYKQCFVGSEAVDYLVSSGYAKSRTEAVLIGRSLANKLNLFEHVARDHEFKDAFLFYRFLTNKEPSSSEKSDPLSSYEALSSYDDDDDVWSLAYQSSLGTATETMKVKRRSVEEDDDIWTVPGHITLEELGELGGSLRRGSLQRGSLKWGSFRRDSRRSSQFGQRQSIAWQVALNTPHQAR